jgi:hypothetical protein
MAKGLFIFEEAFIVGAAHEGELVRVLTNRDGSPLLQEVITCAP